MPNGHQAAQDHREPGDHDAEVARQVIQEPHHPAKKLVKRIHQAECRYLNGQKIHTPYSYYQSLTALGHRIVAPRLKGLQRRMRHRAMPLPLHAP
jgi:hypothetical protein